MNMDSIAENKREEKFSTAKRNCWILNKKKKKKKKKEKLKANKKTSQECFVSKAIVCMRP